MLLSEFLQVEPNLFWQVAVKNFHIFLKLNGKMLKTCLSEQMEIKFVCSYGHIYVKTH